jgi:hypothetical protein
MTTRPRFADLLLGGLVGVIAGAIVAVNVVIYAGIEGGYEATIGEVFEQNVLVGVLAVATFLAGPVLGVLIAGRLRRKRLHSGG